MSSSAPSVEEIGHRLGDAYRGFVSRFSKVPTESKFAVKGTLTPGKRRVSVETPDCIFRGVRSSW